jgi:hypothetical protein
MKAQVSKLTGDYAEVKAEVEALISERDNLMGIVADLKAKLGSL